MVERMRASIVPAPKSAFSLELVAETTGFDPSGVRAITAIMGELSPGAGGFTEWKASCSKQDVLERLAASLPILAGRRADGERRRLVTAEHRSNRAARLARLAAGGSFRNN